MSRNYDSGSRNMNIAGGFLLNRDRKRGNISYATEAAYSIEWNCFSEWCAIRGIKKMENVTFNFVQMYGIEQADMIDAEEISIGTAHNKVCAVNTVMRLATHQLPAKERWRSVSATKDCGIPKRSAIRQIPPTALDRAIYENALSTVIEKFGKKGRAIVELCREWGLRSKEASLLDVQNAAAEASDRGWITISKGTKGGLVRSIQLQTREQAAALVQAAEAQGDDLAVMPINENWKQWREGKLRAIRETIQENTFGDGLHDLRASYACERYQMITKNAAPCTGSKILNKAIDKVAREQISNELGHSRIDVVARYVGGRK